MSSSDETSSSLLHTEHSPVVGRDATALAELALQRERSEDFCFASTSLGRDSLQRHRIQKLPGKLPPSFYSILTNLPTLFLVALIQVQFNRVMNFSEELTWQDANTLNFLIGRTLERGPDGILQTCRSVVPDHSTRPCCSVLAPDSSNVSAPPTIRLVFSLMIRVNCCVSVCESTVFDWQRTDRDI